METFNRFQDESEFISYIISMHLAFDGLESKKDPEFTSFCKVLIFNISKNIRDLAAASSSHDDNKENIELYNQLLDRFADLDDKIYGENSIRAVSSKLISGNFIIPSNNLKN